MPQDRHNRDEPGQRGEAQPRHPQSASRQLRKPLSLSPTLAQKTEESSWQGHEDSEK